MSAQVPRAGCWDVRWHSSAWCRGVRGRGVPGGGYASALACVAAFPPVAPAASPPAPPASVAASLTLPPAASPHAVAAGLCAAPTVSAHPLPIRLRSVPTAF